MFTDVDDENEELSGEQEAPEPSTPRKPVIPKGHGRRALVLVAVPLIGLALVLFMVSQIKSLVSDGLDQAADQTQSTAPAAPGKEGADAPGEETSQVCADVANLRAGPGTDHQVVGSVARGDELLTTTTDVDGWLQLAGTDIYISTTTLCD